MHHLIYLSTSIIPMSAEFKKLIIIILNIIAFTTIIVFVILSVSLSIDPKYATIYNSFYSDPQTIEFYEFYDIVPCDSHTSHNISIDIRSTQNFESRSFTMSQPKFTYFYPLNSYTCYNSKGNLIGTYFTQNDYLVYANVDTSNIHIAMSYIDYPPTHQIIQIHNCDGNTIYIISFAMTDIMIYKYNIHVATGFSSGRTITFFKPTDVNMQTTQAFLDMDNEQFIAESKMSNVVEDYVLGFVLVLFDQFM